MNSDVTIRVDEAAVRRLVADPHIRRALLEATDDRVPRAQLLAPRATGAGAASIRAEAVLDHGVWQARASWDQDHYYMYFHERGTRYMPARPFLEPSFR